MDTADETSDETGSAEGTARETEGAAEPPTKRSRARVIGLAALVVGVIAIVFVGYRVRRKVGVIADATAEIEAELADLDPVERAAVVARLARSAVRDARADRD